MRQSPDASPSLRGSIQEHPLLEDKNQDLQPASSAVF